MTEGIVNAKKITYRRLNQILTALGFVRRQTDEFTAYRDADQEALIVLPVMSARAVVGEPHLIAVRNTLVGKGVATPAEVDALFHPAPKPATTVGTSRHPSAKRQRRSQETVPQAAA